MKEGVELQTTDEDSEGLGAATQKEVDRVIGLHGDQDNRWRGVAPELEEPGRTADVALSSRACRGDHLLMQSRGVARKQAPTPIGPVRRRRCVPFPSSRPE